MVTQKHIKKKLKQPMLKLHITLFIIMLWSFSYSQQYTNITVKDGLPIRYLSKISKLGYIKNDSVYAFASEVINEIFTPNCTSLIGNKLY